MGNKFVCLVFLALLGRSAVASESFGFDQVRARARALSRAAFQPGTNSVPIELLNLKYETYQSIKFRTDKALWTGEPVPFQVGFFLPGFVHKGTVTLHEVTSVGVRTIPFSREAFDFGTNNFSLPAQMEYAGFRLLQNGRKGGEFAAFLGASYFRMIGHGQAFGTSARGLALNTATLGHEEFPVFEEFWFFKPAGVKESSLTLWALMDSPSVTGAFQFVITPGSTTVAKVNCTFFPREEIREFGVAPLTSMFFYDQNSHPPYSDFRPEVHDCDGLQIHTGADQWIWRPLDTAKMARMNSYSDTNPQGFGLMQRERRFERYEDLVARFELRPSVWVEPLGQWGAGRVQLVQLPTDIEFTDNIVAAWIPNEPPKPGEELTLAYALRWTTNQPIKQTVARVSNTRIGQVTPKTSVHGELVRFVIEFDGPALDQLPAAEAPQAEVVVGEGAKLVTRSVVRNEIEGTWRLVIEIEKPAKSVDLSARLTRRQSALSETWMYTWQP